MEQLLENRSQRALALQAGRAQMGIADKPAEYTNLQLYNFEKNQQFIFCVDVVWSLSVFYFPNSDYCRFHYHYKKALFGNEMILVFRCCQYLPSK